VGSRIGDGQAQGVYGSYRSAGLLLRSTKSLAAWHERKQIELVVRLNNLEGPWIALLCLVRFRLAGCFSSNSAGEEARKFVWTTWAVATPGAGGVGRLKAAQSGVATAQKSFFPRPNPALRRHLNPCISDPWAVLAVKIRVKMEVKMGFRSSFTRFLVCRIKTDSESPHFCARNVPKPRARNGPQKHPPLHLSPAHNPFLVQSLEGLAMKLTLCFVQEHDVCRGYPLPFYPRPPDAKVPEQSFTRIAGRPPQDNAGELPFRCLEPTI
jgi:hypothetical protein